MQTMLRGVSLIFWLFASTGSADRFSPDDRAFGGL